VVTVLRSLCKINIHDFERHQRGFKVCSHVEILTDGLFLLARRVCVTSKERSERLEFVARHTVSWAWRLSQDDRTRHVQAWANKRKRLGMTLTLVLVLINKRGWRQYGEAADDRGTGMRRGVRFRQRSRVYRDFGIGGGYDGLRLRLRLRLGWDVIGL